jgi:pimeloyl-ACP methyl ester carboxylesterase
MGDKCAPSTLLETGIEYEGVLISGLLARGYGVAVTDYQGLGTSGTHTYVNRAAEGQAVLDAIRAAQRLPEANLPDAGPVATAGYSQGGGASAAAAELQPQYAPELDLRGSYAGAPPADLKVVGHNLDGHYAAAFLAYAILSLEAAYPDQVDLDEILNERGERLAAQVNEECVWESIPLHALTQSRDLTEDGRPVTAYMDEEPFDTLVEEQRIGLRKPAVPVLVLHSWLDDIVPYDQGRRMARDWCGLGADVEFRTLAVPTHVGGYAESAPYVLGWLEARFAGAPTAGNCGSF